MIGGGDTAFEEVTFPPGSPLGHRRSALRVSKAMQKRAFADGESSFAFDSKIKEKGSMLAGVVLRNVRTGTTRDLGVSGLFLAIGHDPRTELFKDQAGPRFLLDAPEKGA
ncbi:hypothetical protein [Streptomyces sp. MMG1533]|uniref:hypothetical protein n=1 Tax=Streptomyces sp. MMG1533 TaxID=1415546 RepID=UPI0006AFCCFB|nr:hypothetical protein [Streptomyces sp. MMG1533]